jgi:hypothetical protein
MRYTLLSFLCLNTFVYGQNLHHQILLLRGQVLNSITECILVKQLVNKVPLVILQKWIYYWTRVPTERMGKYINNFNSLTLLQYLSNPFIQSVNFQFSRPINDVISVAVFDIRGRLVFNKKKSQRNHFNY